MSIHPDSHRGTVLVIDDDPLITATFAAGLEPDYLVQEAHSAHEAFIWLEQYCPDIILLDIEMPILDGFQTCLRIRQTQDLETVPVIFVSAHESLDDRLRAYDVGGDDFITKPFDLEEIVRKIDHAVTIEAGYLQLNREKKDAEVAALTAMTILNEVGLILNFTRGCLGAHSFEALSDLTIASIAGLGFNAHVQIRACHGAYTRTKDGPASALEESIFERTREIGRLFSFRQRMICNYDNISILITNMPIQDEDLCGRIRDHIAMIAESCSAAITNIDLRMDTEAHARSMQQISGEARTALEKLRAQYQEQRGDTCIELDTMVHTVERMFLTLGLTEEQEIAISETVRASVAKVQDLFDQGINFDGEFQQVLAQLVQVVEMNLNDDNESTAESEVWL